MSKHHDAFQALQQASDGLLFLSETDAPFETLFWPDISVAELTPARVAELASAPRGVSAEAVTVKVFFRNATRAESWHNAEEAAEVGRFKALAKAIETTLIDARVYRIGETRIDCYIVGGIEGGCGGLKTQVVET